MQKKIPMRQCLGCREMKPKKELVRVVRAPDGSVSVDLKGKQPGRGAYVCHSADCLKKALRSNAIGRSLEVTIPPEIQSWLVAQMEAAEPPVGATTGRPQSAVGAVTGRPHVEAVTGRPQTTERNAESTEAADGTE